MSVRTYDLKKNPVIRGASWRFAVNYLNPDAQTPIDLTGATARLRIVRAGDDAISFAAVIDQPTGKIQISLTPDQTGAFNFSQAIYFLDVIFPAETRTILTGEVRTK